MRWQSYAARVVAGLLSVILLAGCGDATAKKMPVEVIHDAGELLLHAHSYAFASTLTGTSDRGPVPTMNSTGGYQAEPQVVHVDLVVRLNGEQSKAALPSDSGGATSGGATTSPSTGASAPGGTEGGAHPGTGAAAGGEAREMHLEYWQDGARIYARVGDKWTAVSDPATLPDIAAFGPAQLSYALRDGVLSAERVREEKTSEGMATVFAVTLDPGKIGPIASTAAGVDAPGQTANAHEDGLTYEVWLLQKNLFPVQLLLKVEHAGRPGSPATEFVYSVRLSQYDHLPAQQVPTEVEGR